MLYHLILILTIVTGSALADGSDDSCSLDDLRRISSCFEAIGFKAAPENFWNITKTGLYCSSSGRTEGNHCVTGFNPRCPLSFHDIARQTSFNDSIHRIVTALNYICSNKDVLTNNRECVHSSAGDVNGCFYDTIGGVVSQRLAEGLTQEEQLQLGVTVGRQVKSCVVGVLIQNCNEDLANVAGNFVDRMFHYISPF